MQANNHYDVIILGAGPAGMTAGIYAVRAGLRVLMLEKGAPGGQMVNTYEVENYTGYEKIQGPELSLKMFEHTQKMGVTYEYGDVQRVHVEGNEKVVTTDQGTYHAPALIVATGTKTRKLDVPGESELAGRGISWCAICDGAFYRGQAVAVVGGGNSALEESLYLTGLVEKVYLIHRRQGFRADEVVIEQVKKNPKIELVLDTVVERFVEEEGKLAGLVLQHLPTKETTLLRVPGAFLYVGQVPETQALQGLVELDDLGYVRAKEDCSTSIPGIFAAGDVRVKELRQIVTATSDGAIAAQNAAKYLKTIVG
ncbi:MAG: thioredoxin-disulfide reductase [Bacilli bacterium]